MITIGYVTLEELGEYFKVKIAEATAIRWRKEGMPYIKIGREVRYDLQAVEEWFKKRTEEEKNEK